MKRIVEVLEDGTKEGVYPGAVLLIACRGEIVFLKAVGHRSIVPMKRPMKIDTVFDLASLTKPLATTLVMMKVVDQGIIDLDQALSELLPFADLRDKRKLTPRLLLSHAAGLADWKPFFMGLIQFPPEIRRAILREQIIGLPFAYSPGTSCIYSDLGFMILEWVIQERTGERLPSYLDRDFFGPLSLKKTFLGSENRPKDVTPEQMAATEDCPWRKKVIQGDVHDENAYALGGYSGHAGLFGTAEEIHAVVDLLREHYWGRRRDYFSPDTVRSFFKRQEIAKDCTWALGWDTPSPVNSSAGKTFSSNSVGHLGFTGTSVWMDLEKDVVVVLLSNRIHPTRTNEKIRAFRPKLHDKVMEVLFVS